MSTPCEPEDALLTVALLHAQERAPEEIMARLEREFGAVAARSEVFPFEQSDYYANEMGRGLLRWFAAFGTLVKQAALADIKVRANQIEAEYAKHGKRSVNIDPGILTTHSLILATGKDYSHRIYLRNGIFAEVTLMVQPGGLQPLPWTYPDYRLPQVLAFFEACRARYLQQRRRPRPASASRPGMQGVALA